jgi:nitrate reductase gamma subunit
MVYKLTSWFRQNVGMGEKNIPTSRRVYAAVKGILGSVLSGKIFALLKVFVFDVLLQIRVLKDDEDRTVWVMHIFIFVGFMLLLLMHALGSIITSSLFSDYQPTLNPFLFLRNFFGVLVVAGLLLAVVRRAVLMKGNVKTNAMDYYVIVILAVIIISGFLLEGIKMSSYTAYRRMVEDYASATEENELQGLEAFWVEKFGVVSPQVQRPISAESLAQGKELHEISCAGCHSRSKWAFIAYFVGKTTKSIALRMDRAGIQTVLWYIHFLSCFFGLAYLPFSKMFHVLATPVSLLVTAVTKIGKENPANVATRQMIELDGCSHGGICHMECPVRRKRQERIEMTPQFDPMLEYVAGKHWKDLGSRHIVG